MKASDLFIQALENEGVEYVFGVPGEENLDFLDSLRKSTQIQFVLTRHEQGAGFMAATYGRLTGKPGVCLATLGPGATNLVTPVSYAQLGAMPLLCITGQKPIKASKQGRFQIVDVVEMMRPITKFTKQIIHANHIPSLVREAFRLAKEEKPGAVHLEFPEDIASETVPEPHLFDVVNNRIPQASTQVLQQAMAMIQEAKRPLLLIGADANRRRTHTVLTAFVKVTGIPFFNTQMAKGIIDERHPAYLGTASLSDHDFLHDSIAQADLIINIGHDIVEKPPFFMHANEQRKVIHINFFSAQIDEIYFPHLNVIGDIAYSIESLMQQFSASQVHFDTEKFFAAKKITEQRLSKYYGDDRFPILPQRLISILRNTIPEDSIITLDNGMYKIWFARNFKAYQPSSLLLDNALATMGAGLPSAIMAKMIHLDKTVISVTGDGGFMMNSQELETAVRLQLDIIVIILRDDAYGMIKWKQQGMGLTQFGLDYTNPDFVQYAASFGAKGYRPQSVDDFHNILNCALHTSGVQVIDLSVDYSLNHQILNVLLEEHTPAHHTS